MEAKQIQHEEVGDAPDFRQASGDEVGVEVPFFKMIESGHEPIRDEEHEPEDETVETATVAPEGFVLVVREEHRQGHNEDQCDEADVGLREFRLQDVPLQILSQLRGEGTTITTLIGNQIEDAQYEEEDAIDEGRDPVELEAKIEDVEVLVMGCERENAEVEQHVDGHQGAGDVTETLIDVSTFSACKRVLYALHFLYCFCYVSGFLLLTHKEAPLCN